MISKPLLLTWSLLLFFLVAAGAVSIVLSVLWGQVDLVRNMLISTSDLIAGLVMGSTFLFTALLALIAILTPQSSTALLHALNWALLACGLEVLSIGSFIWFYTLTERADFDKLWIAQTSGDKQTLQDMFQCCGYFNGTDNAVYAGFCGNMTFATAATTTPCVTPVTGAADVTLNNIFTTIYGFMFIIIMFFLATACVINKREEAERFRRIDEKRGGRGFV